MDILDISRDILKAPVYPGDPEGYLDPIESLREGGRCNLSAFYTCLHAATHIDAPLHFIDGGAPIDIFWATGAANVLLSKPLRDP